MRIFLAGATGALGKQLVPRLIANGHEVVGTTRSEDRTAPLWDAGAEAVVLDALDRDAVVAAVVRAQPDAIVHQLTALAGVDFMRFRKSFALTNRLRTEGTDNLLAGAEAAGVSRIVAQSYAGWPHARVGGAIKSEDDPLDPDPAPQTAEALAAIRYLEERVLGAGGIALRYGGFYGPGTGLEREGEQLELVRKRKFPIVGAGRGVWSFVHIEDAAEATVIALERGKPGIYNITDDEPARVADWLPYLAEIAGSKPPRRLPTWLGRMLGEHLVVMMDQARGASNAKAQRELGWRPVHASWRDGFREMLAA